MFENNTDKMFWTIAVLILGATLLMIGNKAFPKAQESIMSTISQNIETGNNASDNLLADNDRDSKAAKDKDLKELKNNYEYVYNNDGTIDLMKYTNKNTPNHLRVPKWGPSQNDPNKLVKVTTLNDHNPEKYHSDLYMHRATISTVDLPDSIRLIGRSAFYDAGLTKVDIPENVTIIHDDAFRHNHLQTIDIPENVKWIGGETFMDNDLYRVNLNKNLEIIYGNAFRVNSKLFDLWVPDNTMYWTYSVDDKTQIHANHKATNQ